MLCLKHFNVYSKIKSRCRTLTLTLWLWSMTLWEPWWPVATMIITVKLASLWVSPVYPIYQSVKVSNCLLTSQLAGHLDTYSICILMEDPNAHIYLILGIIVCQLVVALLGAMLLYLQEIYQIKNKPLFQNRIKASHTHSPTTQAFSLVLLH